MTARRKVGLAMLASPFIAWYVVGVVAFGWLIPTAVYVGAIVLTCFMAVGCWLALGGDR